MTIDQLAGMMQREFTQIHREMAELKQEMATKRDLKELRAELIEEMKIRDEKLRDELLEEVAKINYDKPMDDLRIRVRRIEKKLEM